MRALVIGADGFAGRWLLRHLIESGDQVAAAAGPRYAGKPLPGDLDPQSLDVRNADAVRVAVHDARPEVIYYLAGISRAGARDSLQLALDVSVHGVLNVLAAAADLGERPVRLLHVGSSHMYAAPKDGTPIREDAPIRPTTIYGAAKAAAEAALLHLGPVVGVDVIGIRAFNHIGPGQADDFVVPSLARQVIAIQRGEQDPVVHAGDLEVRRDFTDVRDVVRAYRLLAVNGKAGNAYNLASGHAVSIGEILDILLTISGVHALVTVEHALTRSDDPPMLVGDAGRLRAELRWRPRIELQTTLADTLAAYGANLAGQPRPSAV